MRHVMDHSAGAHAALAIVAALHQRRRTGQAQHVDLAAREVASAMIGDALVQASVGVEPARLGNGDLSMAPHGVYATGQADRDCGPNGRGAPHTAQGAAPTSNASAGVSYGYCDVSPEYRRQCGH